MTYRTWRLRAVICAAVILLPGAADAGLFKSRPAAFERSAKVPVEDIQRALDEERYVDAGNMLEQAALAGGSDPRIPILMGRLSLARGRYDSALTSFRDAKRAPQTKANALEGEGLALSLMNRGDEALPVLREAVAADPGAWRAWNALAGQYDSAKDWPQAEAAYERAVTLSKGAAMVLNNRGFSRLLQGRADDAVPDFVAALRKKPDMLAARTNLRLAMAMRGDYERALAGSNQDNEAGALNNAGFAALMRGDYVQAEALLERAMQSRGEYYARASTNLELARTLKERGATPPGGVRAP